MHNYDRWYETTLFFPETKLFEVPRFSSIIITRNKNAVCARYLEARILPTAAIKTASPNHSHNY